MKKGLFVLLSLLLFAACDKEYDNHYTIERLASVTEYNADGSKMTVKSYKYYDDGYSVTTTMDDVLQGVSHFTYAEKLEIQTDSAVVDGVLKPSSVTTVYYHDFERREVDSVLTVNSAGEVTLREEFYYDGASYSVITYKDTVQTAKRIIHSYYGTVSADFYTFDTESGAWKYSYNEQTVTSTEYDLTTIMVYVDNQPTEKTMYQSSKESVEFKRYTYSDSSWTMVAYGKYKYETITI